MGTIPFGIEELNTLESESPSLMGLSFQNLLVTKIPWVFNQANTIQRMEKTRVYLPG